MRPGAALAGGVEDAQGVGLTGQVILLGHHAIGLRGPDPWPRPAERARPAIGIGEEQALHAVQRLGRGIGQGGLSGPLQGHGHQVHDRPSPVTPACQGDAAGVDTRILAKPPGRGQHVAGALAAPEHGAGADQGGGVGLGPASGFVGIHDEGPEALTGGGAGVDVDVRTHPGAAMEQDHRRTGLLVGRPIGLDVRRQHVPAAGHRVERPQHLARCLPALGGARRRPQPVVRPWLAAAPAPETRVGLRSAGVKRGAGGPARHRPMAAEWSQLEPRLWQALVEQPPARGA